MHNSNVHNNKIIIYTSILLHIYELLELTHLIKQTKAN